VELGSRVAALISADRPDAVFIDEGGIGGGVIDFIRHLGHSVIGVNFGSTAATPLSGEKAANKRAEMYLSLRYWLREGGAIEDNEELFRQLVAQEYGYQKKTEALILVSKDEQDESPDMGDAIALTFAHPVARRARGFSRGLAAEYDPLGEAALHSFGQYAPIARDSDVLRYEGMVN